MNVFEEIRERLTNKLVSAALADGNTNEIEERLSKLQAQATNLSNAIGDRIEKIREIEEDTSLTDIQRHMNGLVVLDDYVDIVGERSMVLNRIWAHEDALKRFSEAQAEE